MSNNLIDQRDERTKRRKKFKQKIDKIYNLSYKDDAKMVLSADNAMKLSDKSIRLLDEGAVVGDDSVRFIIKKGTLEKFLGGNNEVVPNLVPSETYTVNLGHQDFATFPFIIGEFKKTDLSLVDIGDDRKGIDVDLHLDENSVFVQELKRQPYDIGVSAEFLYHVDWESTNNIGILVIDEVYIFAYGLVGECGNVNSSGLELSGETDMNNELFDGLDETIETEVPVAAELDAETEIEIETSQTNKVNEADESEEVVEENENNAEETETEEVAEDDEAGEEGEGDESDEFAEALDALQEQINTLTNTIKELTEQNTALKKSNRKLNNKLSLERQKKDEFIKNAKSLSVALLPNEETTESTEKKVTNTNYYNGDGIGEL